MTTNNKQLRVIDIKNCTEFSKALHCTPNVVIGRSSETRGRLNAHHTLYYHDKALSATHLGVYLMDEQRDRLLLFNASKHGLIHYSWHRDEFSIITANQVATLQNYDMLGLCLVSDFRNKTSTNATDLKLCDMKQLRNKCRFWIRILSDYQTQLIAKTVSGFELNPHLPKGNIETSFLELCEDFDTYEVISNCSNMKLGIDYSLSPKLNKSDNELVLEMCLNKISNGAKRQNKYMYPDRNCNNSMQESSYSTKVCTNSGLVHSSLFPNRPCGVMSKLGMGANKNVGFNIASGAKFQKNIRSSKRSYSDILDQDGSFERKKQKLLKQNESLKRENSFIKLELEQIKQKLRSHTYNAKGKDIKIRFYTAIITTAMLYLIGKYA